MSTAQINNQNLEHYIARESNLLIDKARHMGIESGKNNTPAAHSQTIDPYIYPLRVGFRGIWRNIQTVIHEQKLKTLAEIDSDRQAIQTKESDEEIRDVGNKVKSLEEKLQRVSQDGYNWLMFSIIFVVFMTLLFYESQMNSGFIMKISPDITVRDARKISFFLYIAMTIIIMAVHYAMNFIKNNLIKKSIMIGVYGILTSFLIAMAYVRSGYVNNNQFSLTSFLFFACINLIFLGSLIFLETFTCTREQFSNFLYRIIYNFKLGNLLRKLDKLKKKYKQNLRDGENIVRNTRESLYDINQYRFQLQSLFEQSISTFVSYNISNRTEPNPKAYDHLELITIEFD